MDCSLPLKLLGPRYKSVITILSWTGTQTQGFPFDEALYWQNLKGGGGGWSMPGPWHNNTPTGPKADTHVEGKHACQRAQEHRQTWWMAPSSHEATRTQTCLEREEGDVWSAPPHHCNTENPIHTHCTGPRCHYQSQQWHCNTIRVCVCVCARGCANVRTRVSSCIWEIMPCVDVISKASKRCLVEDINA